MVSDKKFKNNDFF